jgi:hypothetical protein
MVQLAPPEETLEQKVTAGKFQEVLVNLNGRSMDDMLNRLDTLGFANASYLLGNLAAASGLGPQAMARLEAGIRAMGIRQTGVTDQLLTPLLDAVNRSGVRKLADQFEAIRRKVPPPGAGWAGLIRQQLAMADYGEFLVLSAADNVFRVLDFVSGVNLDTVLGGLDEKQLRMLISSAKAADRYDGERIRQALDAAWRARFPQVKPPWPKAPSAAGMNVAGMSTTDKLAEAIRRSEKFGGAELQGKLAELLTPQALAMMVGTTILFAVLEGSTAGAAGVALVALSALMIGPEVYQVVGDINGFISTSVGAQDEAALDLAGQYFAKAAITISVDVLVAVLLHKPTRAATPKIQAGARAVGEFVKSTGKGSTDLVPALAMVGEGPRFVQAPPERFAPLETTGGGSPPDYASMSLAKLRKLARTDKVAADLLLDRYHRMSDAQLRKLGSDDQTAQAVLRQRITPNDAALAKALGSDYRPPHSATVTVKRGGTQIYYEQLNSGNMTAEEAALGYPRNSLATHTEARAVRNPGLQSGDVMTIMGQYDPCSSCRTAMASAARRFGIRINYVWMGGFVTFNP